MKNFKKLFIYDINPRLRFSEIPFCDNFKMKKFFYNIFLIKINFRKYGIKNISLIIFYELLYTIKLFDFSTNFYEKTIPPKYKK